MDRVLDMELITALVADAANKSGAKLNVLGVFHIIASATFPAHQTMSVVLEFRAKAEDKGKQFEVFTALRAPNGERVVGKSAEGSSVHGIVTIVTLEQDSKPDEPVVQVVQNVKNAIFPTDGLFHLEIFLNKQPKGQIPIEVVRSQSNQITIKK